METRKKKNYFLVLVNILFVMFIFIYVIGETGYHEARIQNETVLTEEAIKQFEQDVLEGKEVDLEKYVKKETVDYSNAFTNIGEKLNNTVLIIINDGAGEIVNIFKYLFS